MDTRKKHSETVAGPNLIVFVFTTVKIKCSLYQSIRKGTDRVT